MPPATILYKLYAKIRHGRLRHIYHQFDIVHRPIYCPFRMGNPSFLEEVRRLSNSSDVDRCIQCGTCSGSCPFGSAIELGPRKIINMIRNGERQRVLSSPDIWLCSSCYTCSGRCPKGIAITDLMYALKRLSTADTEQRKFGRVFISVMERHGRSQESETLTRYLIKRPWKLFAQAGTGLKLFFQGRLSPFPHRVKHRKKIRKMLKRIGRDKG